MREITIISKEETSPNNKDEIFINHMSFSYKNPTSSVTLNAPDSVVRTSDTGTNFSVLGIGGFMEVYNLSDLNWTIDAQTLIDGGPVLYSGNSIPISFSYNVPFAIPNTLTINNDGISSGRRRLGMQVYVHETDTVYQYTIGAYTASAASHNAV